MPQDGEDGEAGKDAGHAVHHADKDGVREAVVVELVVGGEGHQPTPRHGEGEEDLRGRVLPDLEEEREGVGMDRLCRFRETFRPLTVT